VRDLLGFAAEEIIGKQLEDLVAVQELDRTQPYFQETDRVAQTVQRL
jgi:hypothetical protein